MKIPSLYLITDADRVGDSHMVETVSAASRAGLCMVQLREKSKSRNELCDYVEQMRACVTTPMLWILNQEIDLVGELDLDGVHIGGGVVERVGEARQRLGIDGILGYSAHEVPEIQHAFDLGATYVSYSPVFPTRSKHSHGPTVGLDRFEEACESSRGPIYALGGVTAKDAAALRECGAAGLAVIGAIVDARDPARATRDILEAWDGI